MKATLFEFRNRWWVIFFIFFVAFQAYFIDPKNSGVAIADWFARLVNSNATKTDGGYRFIFAIGAVLVKRLPFFGRGALRICGPK